MTFVLSDRVRESNVITGTGAVTLGGSLSGFKTFGSQMANGDTTWYALVDNVANTWEVGVGTWNTGGTLSRTTVLASSNSGSLVSFAGNACDCFMDIPAVIAGHMTDVQIFTSSGTWTKPAWAAQFPNATTKMRLIGAGGGGGGGAQAPFGTVASGGGSGGGGACVDTTDLTSRFTSTVSVTIPASPAGGAGAPGSGSATSCTIQAGSAIILGSNSFYANQQVQFASITTGGSSFATGTVYFVSATGLSGSQFELSATSGGAVITNNATGSAATVYPVGGYNGTQGGNVTFGSYYTAYGAGGGGGGGQGLNSAGGAAGGTNIQGGSALGPVAGVGGNNVGSPGGSVAGQGTVGTSGVGNTAGTGSSTSNSFSGLAAPSVGGSASGGTLLAGSASAGGNGASAVGTLNTTGGASGSSGTAGAGANATGNGSLFPNSSGCSGGGANTGGIGGQGGGPGAATYGSGGAGGGGGTVSGGAGGAGAPGYAVILTMSG